MNKLGGMITRRKTGLALLVGLIIAFLLPPILLGQESILSVTIWPEKLQVASGQAADLRLSFSNKSLYAADDIAVSIIDADGFSVEPSQASIKVVPAYGKESLDLQLYCSSDAAAGPQDIRLLIIYTYCIDVSCFQIIDQLTVPLVVTEGAGVPVAAVRNVSIPQWIWLAVVGLLLTTSGLLWRQSGIRAPFYAILALLIIGGFAYGIMLGQHEQAQGIAAVLCTSCVGIEESQHDKPMLSTNAKMALADLATDIELVVFYAPWCHTCPYAEELVQLMGNASSHIIYKLVNVDEDRDIAARSGVIRNQRTVVPAILRVDTGEVVFGIEDLETRLLKLIGVGR
jgi:thiol-disulfide isomerase/thioredoxin